MKVCAIQNHYSKFYAPNYSLKTENPVETANTSCAQVPDSYGKDIVTFKSRSKNAAAVRLASIPLEEKLAFVLNKMDIGEYLVVAKDANKVKEVLSNAIDRIKVPVESIMYMEEPKMKESLFFFLNPMGQTIFYNPNSFLMRLNGFEEIEPGEMETLSPNDRLRFSNGWKVIPSLSDVPHATQQFLDSKFSSYVHRYDYYDEVEKLVKDHNQKVLRLFAEPKVQQERVTAFSQVGGQDELIDKLKKHVLFPLKYPAAFEGLMVNKGVVLYGPPGTGKTLLAQALAAEAGASAFELCATDLEDKFVGESERNCRELFQKAVESQPSIICFDEFDALGKSRGGQDVHGDKLLNQLLSLMSDIEKRGDRVVVVASTNRKEALDPAVLRSGRFDLQLEVKAPDLAGTKQILGIKLKGKPVDRDLDFDNIAEKMFAKKMTGADITATVRNAHINALDREGIYKSMDEGRFSPAMMDYFKIQNEDFQKAIDLFSSDNKSRRPIGYGQIK